MANVLVNKSCTNLQLVEKCEKLTFDKFLDMKSKFLQNLEMIWLIQGHLTKEDALQMVETTENALTFRRISEDDISAGRCIRLKDRTIYSFEKDNISEKNPNSCCKAVFQD